MIISLGLDLVELGRMQQIWDRFGSRFAERILSEQELAQLPQNPVEFLASRFAAKEAGAKALGTGFSSGVAPRLIEMQKQAAGKPQLRFLGAADQAAQALGVRHIPASLSHTRQQACCVVILEK
ncbi:MAG: holo-[acyl-carrier-protein] synthase [Desulfohalobiaceae bacterium]